MAFRGHIGALKSVVFAWWMFRFLADLDPQLVLGGRLLNSSDWYQVVLFCLPVSTYIHENKQLASLYLFAHPR